MTSASPENLHKASKKSSGKQEDKRSVHVTSGIFNNHKPFSLASTKTVQGSIDVDAAESSRRRLSDSLCVC
ncbi:hypothetical protein F2P81_024613 [Scophthalmus maximus]|uniref:Uncharacterized protein n=1 Tax=Scophthalmus maximus TaxID=52904 RepID=A0A6A4RPU9_SCOMX|nr:hypothetical protein F2P81_024613 [Scophthalmus maximus]